MSAGKVNKFRGRAGWGVGVINPRCIGHVLRPRGVTYVLVLSMALAFKSFFPHGTVGFDQDNEISRCKCQ
jgi:hypothetical protein